MRTTATLSATWISVLIGASSLLAGCSESNEMRAAKACIAEMDRKIHEEDGDRRYAADISKIAAAAKANGEGIIEIESEATLDAGQPKETNRRFTCRVRFDPANPEADPQVILFHFFF